MARERGQEIQNCTIILREPSPTALIFPPYSSQKGFFQTQAKSPGVEGQGEGVARETISIYHRRVQRGGVPRSPEVICIRIKAHNIASSSMPDWQGWLMNCNLSIDLSAFGLSLTRRRLAKCSPGRHGKPCSQRSGKKQDKVLLLSELRKKTMNTHRPTSEIFRSKGL